MQAGHRGLLGRLLAFQVEWGWGQGQVAPLPLAPWDIDFHLLMLCSGCPEILEVDQGGSLGAKKSNADLDFEIVDRAGECTPNLCSHPTSPGWAGRDRKEKAGIFRGAGETPQGRSREE